MQQRSSKRLHGVRSLPHVLERPPVHLATLRHLSEALPEPRQLSVVRQAACVPGPVRRSEEQGCIACCADHEDADKELRQEIHVAEHPDAQSPAGAAVPLVQSSPIGTESVPDAAREQSAERHLVANCNATGGEKLFPVKSGSPGSTSIRNPLHARHLSDARVCSLQDGTCPSNF